MEITNKNPPCPLDFLDGTSHNQLQNLLSGGWQPTKPSAIFAPW
jgi:hypothetical protein